MADNFLKRAAVELRKSCDPDRLRYRHPLFHRHRGQGGAEAARGRASENHLRGLAAVKPCHRERVPVTTQGGMTGFTRATMPHEGEIVLSMERMNNVAVVSSKSRSDA
jgi:FAD/FMN-containing dehydrogenase